MSVQSTRPDLNEIFPGEGNDLALAHVCDFAALRLQLPLYGFDRRLPCKCEDDSAALWLYDLNNLVHL